ncbi:MAG: hypothetical protein AB1689_20920, partial [Thermodesulfobacteriota bacterium]
AAYGVLLAVERLPRRARWLATAAVAACALWETFAPASLPPAGRRPATLAAYRVQPSARAEALARRVPDGAVLDLPLSFDATGKLVDMPHYVLLAAYHRQPAAACYNSFRTPLQFELAELAQRLPDPAAAEALHALGFRNLVLHRRRLGEAALQRLAPLLHDPSHAVEVAQADDMVLYELRSPHETSHAPELLAAPPGGALAETSGALPLAITRPSATLDVVFVNRGATSFRHPTLEPSQLELRWRDARGDVVATSQARALLPMALAPGATTRREIPIDVPEAIASGPYTVELAPAERPELTLARRSVVVGQARAVDAASGSSTASSSSLGLVSP